MNDFIPRYKAAVASGFSKIPYSIEMERMFGPCDHFIGHQPGLETQRWNSEVIVEGRYELTMQCDIIVNEEFDEVLHVASDPVFYLREIERVHIDGQGRATAWYSEHNQRTFGREEWKKVVSANGDLSVVGIDFKSGRPVQNVSEYKRQMSQPRVSVRPNLNQ